MNKIILSFLIILFFGNIQKATASTAIVTASATPGDGTVTINWTTSSIDIRNIQIMRNTSSSTSGRTRIGTAGTDDTSYTDSDVDNGTTYYYWVKITDTDLNTYNSGVVEATPSADVEGTITLSATPGDGTVTLNWTTSDIDIKSIQVMRDTDSDASGRTRIGYADSGDTSYTDSDVSAGTTYYYWLKITDTSSNTYNSGAVEATLEEGSVRLTATSGEGYVTLNWSSSNIDISSIQIMRDTDSDPSGRTRIGYADTDDTSYTDSDVTGGTTYYYWVKIIDGDSNTYNSDVASATPSEVTDYTEGDGYGANPGGNDGTTVTVDNADDLIAYAASSDSYIIKVSGTIDLDGESVEVGSNTTITGVSESSKIENGNLDITDEVSNVIVKYLTFTNPNGDGITIWTAYNVFVNHCTFYDCADGCCDITRGSDYITVSYCKFYYVDQTSHRFTMILGNTDESEYHTTLHHNWWADNCDQRMPSGSYSHAHVYNNYFSCEGNSYCTNGRIDTEWLVEANYYDGVSDPCYYENGGVMEINDNYYNNCDGEISESNGSVSVSYSYTLDEVEDVPTIVAASAGNIWDDVTATLTKHGTGSSSQTVSLGNAISSFYYSWENASTVSVSGIPDGITTSIDTDDQTVTFSGTPTETGSFTYAVTTVGATTNVSKGGTITVTSAATSGFLDGILLDENGSDEVDSSSGISVYPNPVQDVLNIKKGSGIASVYNMLGDLVYQAEIDSDVFEIEMSAYAKGIYILIVNGDNGIYKQLITKE